MIPLSILDLAPVSVGSTVADSFAASKALAQLAETLGYHRYWLAEHHNMPGIASAATSGPAARWLSTAGTAAAARADGTANRL